MYSQKKSIRELFQFFKIFIMMKLLSLKLSLISKSYVLLEIYTIFKIKPITENTLIWGVTSCFEVILLSTDRYKYPLLHFDVWLFEVILLSIDRRQYHFCRIFVFNKKNVYNTPKDIRFTRSDTCLKFKYLIEKLI